MLAPSYCEEIDRRGCLSHALYVNVCRIIGRHDRPAAPPGTGICKPAFGVAARYRQTVAAVD